MAPSALYAPFQRRTEYLTVSVVLSVEFGALALFLALNLTLPLRLLIALKAISRKVYPNAGSVLKDLAKVAAHSFHRHRSRCTGETKSGCLVNPIATKLSGSHTLTERVDEVVERTEDTGKLWVLSVAGSAFALSDSVPFLAFQAVKDAAETETVGCKQVAIVVDEEPSGRAGREAYSVVWIGRKSVEALCTLLSQSTHCKAFCRQL